MEYLEKSYIESISFHGYFMSGRTDNDKWFYVRDDDGVLQNLFAIMKERFIKDREMLVSNSIHSLRNIDIFCADDYYAGRAQISEDKKTIIFDVSLNSNDFGKEREFVISLLDLMLDYNYPYLALIENFWFDKGNVAKSLKSYTLKQGPIRIHFDFYLYDIVLEWIKGYEECTGKKMIKVLNGGENFPVPFENRDYSLIKKIKLIRGGKL